MPPLIIWGAGVLGSALIARWAVREARRVNRVLDEARQAQMTEAGHVQPPKTLRLDPRTGAYRAQ